LATVNLTISGTGGTASVPVTFTVNDAQVTLGNGDKLYLFNSADFRNSAGVGSYNYGIFGARITATGIASPPVPLAIWPNSDTGYNYVAGLQHGGVKFAPLPSGGFVLVWEIDQWSGRSLGVFARFFDSNGDPTTGQIPAGYDPDQTQSWAGGGPNNPTVNSDTSVSTSFLKGIYPNNFNNSATVDLANIGFTVSAASTAEGSSAVFTFRVPTTAAGVTLPYSISGIQSSDTTVPLTGTVTVGSDGRATISVPLVIDSSTENETATVNLMGFNSSTIIVDSTTVSSGSSTPICFARGTFIKSLDRQVPVEELIKTTLISNANEKRTFVKWIGYQRRTPEFAQFQDYLPVKISAGALDDNLPLRDLYLSPDHAVLVDGHLIHAKALVNGKTIVQMTEWEGDIEYYHIETEAHEIIYAEGVPCETFIDNVSREQFDNYAEYQALYPNTRMMKELPLPRVKFKRQLPLAIRQRLESRISELDRQKKG
jgi:hypothetical protein